MMDRFDNIITDDVSHTKLLTIIDKRIVNSTIDLLFDLTAIISTSFIIDEISNKVKDDYGKKTIKTTGAILFIYELNRGINSMKMTKFLLEKRKEIL